MLRTVVFLSALLIALCVLSTRPVSEPLATVSLEVVAAPPPPSPQATPAAPEEAAAVPETPATSVVEPSQQVALVEPVEAGQPQKQPTGPSWEFARRVSTQFASTMVQKLKATGASLRQSSLAIASTPTLRLANRPQTAATMVLHTATGNTIDDLDAEPELADLEQQAEIVDETDQGVAEPVEETPVVEELLPEQQALREKLRYALKIYYNRRLNTRDHCPWEIMHTVISFGVRSQVSVDGPNGRPVTAIGWLCYNRPCRGMRTFYSTGRGFVPHQGPGLQGHAGQLLAILAQARLKTSYPIHVSGKTYTVADLVEYEKRTCQKNTELTFKLIGLSHYLDANETWESEYGQQWSIAQVVREELRQPVRGAACGGTHRLFGLAYAVQRRAKQGHKIEGIFEKAQNYITQYHRYTFGLQNPDGSFSTEWFTGRGARPDVDRRMQTTGHILELMVASLPRSELDNPQIIRSVNYLADLLLEHRNRDWENGPLGHAVSALALYQRLRFKEPAAPTAEEEGRHVAVRTARKDDAP